MYLKRLTLQGFKSFPNRTVFEARPGVTAIVGPNGSGKSNVADAIRWVLGEQNSRLLRTKKQEDVIFSGTAQRKPVGMAEVILTLDNEDRWLPLDFAEIEVGRRVYRNGDSEYLLNGSRVRLRDVMDLLLKGDVGQNSYAIMGQGLVDEVLSMSPDERRTLVDEAADVRRFRTRIREAQDRLAATRDNMERVALLVAEIKPRLTQLERQAGRAHQHSGLANRLADLLQAWFEHRWTEAQDALVRARAAVDQRTAADATAAARVDQLREQLRALAEEIRKRRDAIARRDTSHSEHEQRLGALEQALALDRERHAMIAARREEVRLEEEAIEAEYRALASTDLSQGQRELEVGGEVEGARASMADQRSALEQAEHDYARLRSRAQELRDGAEADTRRAQAADEDWQASTARTSELEAEGEEAAAARRKPLAELAAYGRRFRDLRAELQAAQSSFEASRSEAEMTRERLARLQDEVRSYEAASNAEIRELDLLESRLEALRRLYSEHESLAGGTRGVLIMGQALLEGVGPGTLGEPPEVAGVHGLVAGHLRVPAGLEVAISAALQHRLHAVIIEREADALAAIALLRRRHQGRAQFMPLDTIRHVYPLNLQKERGVVGVAARLVRCEQAYRAVVDTLLGRVIICDDVEAGLRMIRRGLGSVVTLDGTVIEQTGALSGGGVETADTAFARQREVDELPARIEGLRQRTGLSSRQLENARQAIAQMVERSAAAEAAYNQARTDWETTRESLERERDRLHRLRWDMGRLRARLQEIRRALVGQQRLATQAQLAIEHGRARAADRTAELAGMEADVAAAAQHREAALRAVAEASSRLAGIEGERKALDALREQHASALQRLAGQVAARRLQGRNLELEASVIDERLGKHGHELEPLQARLGRHGDDAAPDRDELTRLEAHERQVQEELSAAQADLLDAGRRRLEVEAEADRAQAAIADLQVEMDREGLAADRSGRVRPLVAAPAGTVEAAAPRLQGAAAIDVEATRKEIEDLRRQIRRLGPINEEALGDYEENRERYEFLTTQTRDLEEAEAQLRKAIAELSVQVRTRFDAAFEQVNAAFGEYFQAFFGGGSARLRLVDPDHRAESGLEMEAQPPGKRISSLAMLSGGERSLTAVALLFALLAANPAPFCVLDEVDAALDEANVGRFTDALSKLAERTQFLIVTHNRRTIEVAEAIYGVSMGREGISKVLSLRLSDLPTN